MAQKIAVDGTITEVSPRSKTFTLKELYEHCQCSSVQVITLSDGREMYFDEEGKFAWQDGKKERNETATRIAARDLFFGDFIVGAALVGTPEEFYDDEEEE